MLKTTRTALTLLLCTAASCAAPSSSSTVAHQHAQPPPNAIPAPLSPEVIALRMRLVEEAKQIFVAAYPSYNGIKVDVWGLAIVAAHPLFTGYEFTSGPLAPTLQQWMQAHRAEFTQAQLRAVGVESLSGGGVALMDIAPVPQS